jgi:hypothetical protein
MNEKFLAGEKQGLSCRSSSTVSIKLSPDLVLESRIKVQSQAPSFCLFTNPLLSIKNPVQLPNGPNLSSLDFGNDSASALVKERIVRLFKVDGTQTQRATVERSHLAGQDARGMWMFLLSRCPCRARE